MERITTNVISTDQYVKQSNTNTTEAKQQLIMSSQCNYSACDQRGGDEKLSNQANGNLITNGTKNTRTPYRFFNNFRRMSIFPGYNDVHRKTNPFMPTNIVKGKFESVDQYLDINFRLNREDFFRPFSDGIKEYRVAINVRKDVNDLKNIRIYTNVHILGSQYHDYKYDIQFDTTKLTHINWNISKRLINGSLVCFTKNNFQSFCLAIVCGERDVDLLSDGKICVEFLPDSIDKEFIGMLYEPSKSLIMAESVVYFESYRHTLLTLQNFSSKTFPLQEYIIKVSTNIKTVPYLTNSSKYNLSQTYNVSSETYNSDNNLNSKNNLINKSPLESVNILNEYDWPRCDLLSLDGSQYEAFKVALTKQIAIIQGPPGTGKTYVGLRIAQTLLQNKKFWNKPRISSDKTAPIVIVAKTNHALDQFLEGLVPCCRANHRLVRIGCQSKSEILKKYDLDRNNYSDTDSKFAKLSLTETQALLLKYQSVIDKLNKQLLTENEIKLLKDSKYSDIVSQLKKYNDDVYLALIKWLFPNLTIELESVPVLTEKEHNSDINDDIEEMVESRIINETDYILLSNGKTSDTSVDNVSRLFSNLRISDRQKIGIQTTIERELKSNDVMSEKEANFIHDVMRLPCNYRWRLYRLWVKICVDKVQLKLNETEKKYRKEVNEFNKLKKKLISQCDIIGLTTTGAAKYRNIIEELDPLIVIIEEAAEVLESHVITALTASTCHLILIGDHQQLRPNPVVYELAVRRKLDVSMFERLINNGLPYCQLKVQHRMCPLISSLLVPHFYTELIDHESVKKYETIRGVCKHVCFINHNQPESTINDSTSKMNRFEAEFITRLCKYLIQQEYSPSQITILTMYSAQLFHLRNILKQCKPSLSNVRVAVLDNFQGEENDIILLSFVRSNNLGDSGFVKIANRVNVALSRAKKGMYCIGNFDCLSQKSDLWKSLVAATKEKDIMSTSLEIYCQNHLQRQISVSKASDFDKAPEGGCDKHCEQTLKCKHKCPLTCHSYDKNHDSIACVVPCPLTVCKSNHKCKKLCHNGKDCGKCYESVIRKIPSCGHSVAMACCHDPSTFHCPTPCYKSRSCGHQCYYSCGYICDQFPCKVKVVRQLACGHNEEMRCSENTSTAFCSNACLKTLACGHPCAKKCGDVCDNESCKVLVSVALKCGHSLTRQCSEKAKKAFCQLKCYRLLECGHYCLERCGHQCYGKFCNIFKTIKFSCGHEAKTRCNQKAICRKCNNFTPQNERNTSQQRKPFSNNSRKVKN